MAKMVKMRSWPVDLVFFVLCIYFFSSFAIAEDELKKYEYLVVDGQPSDAIYFHALRVKRDTDSTLPNHTTFLSTDNSTVSTTAQTKPQTENITVPVITVPKTNESIITAVHTNLGVNGTGQKKIIDQNITLTNNKTSTANYTISEPIAEDVTNLPDEFEEHEDKLLADHNITNTKNDTHDYYNSTFLTHYDGFDVYWSNLLKSGEIKINTILSKSHRRAATLRLSFDFPFYGQPIKNITIATGGFLFTGDYVHSWLAATQYIAPLMANFDTALDNDSYVKYIDNGTALTVFWENVKIQERYHDGNFTFAATLSNNGDITFAYKNVPFNIESIKDENHPVKVGLSDAYIIDRIVFLVRRKTIYEYHRVDLRKNNISNGTLIRLTALPTCLEYATCEECTNHQTVFNCSWCTRMNKCSNGNYRLRQEWNVRNCDKNRIEKTSACPKDEVPLVESPNDPATSYATNKNNPIHDVIINQKDTSMPAHRVPSISAPAAAPATGSSPAAQSSSFGGVLAALAAVVAIGACAAWIVYAYRNPHTRSGQILIRYRPSQWGWRRGEARYTAATIHM